MKSSRSQSDHGKEWLALAVILFLVVLISGHFQERMETNYGRGWDGIHYFNTAYQIFEGETVSGQVPFVYRQLVPWLVAKFSSHPSEFLDVATNLNVFFGVVAAFLSLLLLRGFVRDWRIRVFVVSLYPLLYTGAIRYSSWLSFDTYPFAHLSAVAVFLALQRIHENRKSTGQAGKWYCLLTAALFFTTLNRSSGAVLIVVLPFCLLTPTDWKKSLQILKKHLFLMAAPAAAILAAIIVVRQAEVTGSWVGDRGGDSFFLFFMAVVYEKSMLMYAHSVFTAFGPLLILLVWQYRTVFDFLSRHLHFLMAVVLYVAYGSGADVEPHMRIIYIIYLILLGIVIEDKLPTLLNKKITMTALLIGQAISHRLFWTLPINPPPGAVLKYEDPWPVTFFTPLTNDFMFFLTTVEFNPVPLFGLMILMQYLLFSALILVGLVLPSRQEKIAPAASKIPIGKRNRKSSPPSQSLSQ